MQLPFKKKNIIYILIGVGLIVLGYLLMSTENFIDAEKFSLSLWVCPVLIIGGHIVVAYGIILKDPNAAVPASSEAPDVPKA